MLIKIILVFILISCLIALIGTVIIYEKQLIISEAVYTYWLDTMHHENVIRITYSDIRSWKFWHCFLPTCWTYDYWLSKEHYILLEPYIELLSEKER